MAENRKTSTKGMSRKRQAEQKRKKKLRILFGELIAMVIVLVIALVIFSPDDSGENIPDKTEKSTTVASNSSEDGKNDEKSTDKNGSDDEKETKDDKNKDDEKETKDDKNKEDEKETNDSTETPDFSEFLNSGAEVTIPEGTDFSEYSREKVPYGFGTDVDSDNRPGGCNWYSNKFGQFACDFIQPKSNYVFLTFDEGYEYGFTPAILDTLKEKNVKAVFFITLPYAKDNPELVQRMIDEGHVIGNHTSTHPAGGIQQYTVEEMKNDIDAVTKYVKENFNYDMYLFRFPEGAFSEQALAVVQSLGYRSVFWSFAYADWDPNNQPDITSSLKNATDKLHGGAIYLLHAESETNTKMLGDFIDAIREKGLETGYYSKTKDVAQ